MDYKKAFIKNLKEYRKQKKLTQDDLAEILGYSQKNVAKWEQGYSIPSVDVAIELSKKMNISLNDLFGLEEKSLLEQCIDYILEKQNRVGNCSVKYCVDKDYDIWETSTWKELEEETIYRMARIIIQSFNEDSKKFRNDFFEQLYITNTATGEKRDKLYISEELFLEFFKSNGNIKYDDENGLYVSSELMLECYEIIENSLLRHLECREDDDLVELLNNQLNNLREFKEKYLSEK